MNAEITDIAKSEATNQKDSARQVVGSNSIICSPFSRITKGNTIITSDKAPKARRSAAPESSGSLGAVHSASPPEFVNGRFQLRRHLHEFLQTAHAHFLPLSPGSTSRRMACRSDFFKGTRPISRTFAFTDPTRLPRDLAISATLAFCLTVLLSRMRSASVHGLVISSPSAPARPDGGWLTATRASSLFFDRLFSPLDCFHAANHERGKIALHNFFFASFFAAKHLSCNLILPLLRGLFILGAYTGNRLVEKKAKVGKTLRSKQGN